MPLAAQPLADALAQQWLVQDSGYPSSTTESAKRFAGAVADWFNDAMAGGFLCVTAKKHRPILMALTASALAVGQAQPAGQALALAVAVYFTGQSFGSGTSLIPMAVPATAVALGRAFANLDASRKDRADQIAGALLGLAQSTLVVFPSLLTSGTVM